MLQRFEFPWPPFPVGGLCSHKKIFLNLNCAFHVDLWCTSTTCTFGIKSHWLKGRIMSKENQVYIHIYTLLWVYYFYFHHKRLTQSFLHACNILFMSTFAYIMIIWILLYYVQGVLSLYCDMIKKNSYDSSNTKQQWQLAQAESTLTAVLTLADAAYSLKCV